MPQNIKIGLEIHIQLSTKTKLFCSCKNPATLPQTKPNSLTCVTCLGHPGSKPLLNKQAIEQALKVALALNCKINKEMFFSRKTYFYPDLPKNFQISQYETPLATNGNLDSIRIKRLHLEEDPGRLIHQENFILIDYNRSGTPLIEIVTEPDFTSTSQVREFLKTLTTILTYLNIYTKTSEASMRTDANISINNNERVEIKNITGTKEVERALNYEIQRQKKQPVKLQETRSWLPEKSITILTRTKETEQDYGYIIEPDLTKIKISNNYINQIKKQIPELPTQKIKRIIKQYNLTEQDAKVIASDSELADLFEKLSSKISPTLTAKWLKKELLRVLHYNKKILQDLKINNSYFIELLSLLEKKQITMITARRILEKLIQKPFSPKEYVKKQNLSLISDKTKIEEYCKKAIKQNQKAIKDYKQGKEQALNFVVGYVMKLSKGKANPKQVNKILKKLIK